MRSEQEAQTITTKKTESLIGLIDCNNFFASCEEIFKPWLRNQPCAVLSNNDGCIIARNSMAKKIGLKMGEPYFKAQGLIKQFNVAIFSSNFKFYGEISKRVTQTIASSLPNYEIYSIDESFVDFSGINNPEALAHELRSKIQKWVSITTSIGIAPTKTLSKVANYYAKKSSSGVWILNNEDKINAALELMPVSEVWGVGWRLKEKLNDLNIKTALDLKNYSLSKIRRSFSVVLARTVLELRGVPCLNLSMRQDQRKSIVFSRSFGTKITSITELNEAIAEYTSRGAEKLRKNNLVVNQLVIFIKANRFTNNYFSKSILVNLDHSTDDSRILIRAAQKATKEIFIDGYRYGKCGVMFLNLTNNNLMKCSLLSNPPSTGEQIKNKILMETIDNINRKLEYRALSFGACGTKKRWWMKGRNSPKF